MTPRELIAVCEANPRLVMGAMASIPACAFLLGLSHRTGEGGRSPWRELYAVLVYAACIPGMFSAALIAYALFVTHENLLDASIPAYFSPLLQMAVSLALMSRNVDFEEVPGFDKVWGLMGILGVTFTTVLFIQKVGVLVIFHGSLMWLGLFAGALFLILRASARALLGPGSRARP